MLTRELGIIAYDRTRARPDMLVRSRHRHYVDLAGRALQVYREGAGRTRRELHRAVREIFEEADDCPEKRIGAFCKLLDDQAVYDRAAGRTAPKLRRRIWETAAAHHPLVTDRSGLLEHREDAVKALIVKDMGRATWDELAAEMWADVMECQRLTEFPGYTDAAALLARYNVAQYQTALFDATEMTLHVTEDLKTIVRAAKLARLLLDIRRLGEGRYKITLAGAASPLRETKRYGAEMARFLPSLLSCKGWKLEARLMRGRSGYRWTLEISPETGLRSPVETPTDFDSELERAFHDRWQEKDRDGWRLLRESELIWKAQTVFIPDFTLVHDESGRSVHLEIVGFWTPEYIEEKIRKLELLETGNVLIAIQDKAWRPEFGNRAIRYKTVIRPEAVLEALSGME